MSRRTERRGRARMHARRMTTMRRHHKRGERQEFRRETRHHLGVQP
jgi:hypothetical protein